MLPRQSPAVESPFVEVTLTVPEAIKVISHVVQNAPEVIVGAGSVHDVETARRCLDAGAKFLSSDGLDPDTVKFAVQQNVVVIPGTLTPTGVITAWKLGPDFVKVVPCGHIGGDSYIRDSEGDVSLCSDDRRRRRESAHRI